MLEYPDDTRIVSTVSFRIGDRIEVLFGNYKGCQGTVRKVTKIQMEVAWTSGRRKPLEELVAGTSSRINQANARLLQRATPPPVRVLPDYNEGHYLSQCISYRNMIRENAVRVRDEMTSLVNLIDDLTIVDAQRVAQIQASVSSPQRQSNVSSPQRRSNNRRRRR